MTNSPTVEVLLGTYNGEKYLSELIDSIINQTYENVILTIRDDNSQDRTKSILKKYRNSYPDRISVIYNDTPPFGIITNYSELLAASKSPYLMFADQDDVWLPDKVELSLQALQDLEATYGKEAPLLVHTDLIVVNENLETVSPSFWEYSGLISTNLSLNRLLVQNVVTGCTSIFNRPLAKLTYPIPEAAIMHDYWLALVASAVGKIGRLDKATILYRQHGENALGAQKWSWNISYYLRKGHKILFTKAAYIYNRDLREQAFELISRLENVIGNREKKTLQLFIDLENHPPIVQKYILVKHRFLKGRWQQNIGFLIKG